MAKGRGASAPVKANTAGDRKNGKARKKNPGPAQPPKTNFEHINGRSPESNAKREEWKKRGGRWNHKTIPHWKTGLVYKPTIIEPAFDPEALKEAISA